MELKDFVSQLMMNNEIINCYMLYWILLIITLMISFKKLLLINENYVNTDNTPPGPIGLPIVGYLPFIGKKPHKKFKLLGQKYGNVFSLQMGSMKVVVLNDFEAIKEAFKKDEFLGRPENIVFNVVMELKGLGTLSGHPWREQKRFTMHQLRNLGFGKTKMEEHIMCEMTELIQRIESLNGNPIEVRALLASSTSSNISALVFGKRFEYNDPNRTVLDTAIESAVRKLGQTGPITFFPQFAKICANLGLFGLSQLRRDFFIVNDYIHKQIEEHKQTLDPNNIRDYIDAFLIEMQHKQNIDSDTTFTLQMLSGNVQGFFAAGSETVKITMEWALLIISGHKEIQEKVQKEMDYVCGKNGFPSWGDRYRMPYTQAVINEIHRWKTISPLNLLRETTHDTNVMGYFIPKGTAIIANLWFAHHDPLYWKDPNVFNPNRFLNSDETQIIKYDHFIPFSIGKRSCPGETFAQIEVFLGFTSLLKKFNISSPNPISYKEETGLMTRPKHTVTLIFEKRN